MRTYLAQGGAVLVGCLIARPVFAGPVQSGNDLALDFASASAVERKRLARDADEHLFFFRYLRITEIERGETDGRPFVRMNTVEPSSDMQVAFTVRKQVSLRKVREQGIGRDDGIAVVGRVTNINQQAGCVFLGQVIVRYKDRLLPKTGKELLHEVDPAARKGSDTSSGKEVIIHGRTER